MKKGFTLAEVLITLGIVGVVAVLTIPGVMKNYQNRIYTAQLEKVYAQLSEATQSIMNDEHVDNFYETTAGIEGSKSDETINGAYFLTKYFKYIKKNCTNNTEDACLANRTGVYTAMDGRELEGTGAYSIQLPSGAVVGAAHNDIIHCMSIIVDVNALTGPNIAGRDVFAMDILPNGTIVDYSSGCNPESRGAPAHLCGTVPESSSTSLANNTRGCLNNIMQAGWKMEY